MTDFEKLLYAEGYIKELKEEIRRVNYNNGVLKSEIDTIMHYLKTNQPRSSTLMKYKKIMTEKDKAIKKYKDEIDKYKLDTLNLNKQLSYYKLLNKQLCQQ